MFHVENMMGLLATAVLCSDTHDNNNDATTYYRITIKQIEFENYASNENGICIVSTDKKKTKYFEIKQGYFQSTNNGSTEECEVKLVSAKFDLNKINDNKHLVFVTDKHHKLKFLSKDNVVVFKNNTFELNNCIVTDAAFGKKKKNAPKAKGIKINSECCDYNRLVIMLRDKVKNVTFDKYTVFEIPTDEFMVNPVFKKIDEEGNDTQSSSESDVTINNTESEEIENNTNNESKEMENDPEKTTVVPNNSLSLTTKIVLGITIPIFCLFILTCAIVVYKRRNIRNEHIITVESELTCHQV